MSVSVIFSHNVCAVVQIIFSSIKVAEWPLAEWSPVGEELLDRLIVFSHCITSICKFLFEGISSSSGCLGRGCVNLLWHSMGLQYNY